MKKLMLNPLAFSKGEVLSRNQLKTVLGGLSGSGSSDCQNECGPGIVSCPSGTTCQTVDDRQTCGIFTKRCF